MKVYDISQEVFSCEVYPGDPPPSKKELSSISRGDSYNLTAFSMCAHNGTHIDAPAHFIRDGLTVDKIPLSKTVGFAYVAECEGEIKRKDAQEIVRRARAFDVESAKRILVKGASVSDEAADYFASLGIILLGTEHQSVGDDGEPLAAHLVLLKSEVVILEGLRLDSVSEGVYFLSAAPLNLSGFDGAPSRAILVKFD